MERLNICQEVPVILNVNGNKHITFMCTPANLTELAMGYLHSSRGCDPAQIESVAACEDLRVINVQMSGNLDMVQDLKAVLSSSCGSGYFNDDFLLKPSISSDFSISLEKAAELAKEMFVAAKLYKQHGGVHVSAISDGEKMLAAMEDVGRHNSVDKVIGYAILNDIDIKKCCIITSGRVAADMAIKAVNAQIPVVITRSIPTSLAYEIAEQKGVTFVGRILKDKEIFTHPHRII